MKLIKINFYIQVQEIKVEFKYEIDKMLRIPNIPKSYGRLDTVSTQVATVTVLIVLMVCLLFCCQYAKKYETKKSIVISSSMVLL